MLSLLDDTLMHQASIPFEYTSSSDHRFFDRYALAIHHDGEAAIYLGLGVYKNMNVMDGFALCYKDKKQFNLRLSRELRPNLPHMKMDLGPLSVEIIKPLQTLRLYLEADRARPTSFDLVWDAIFPPWMEPHHFSRKNGRVVNDYWRYDQVGKVNGHLKIGNEKIEVKDWFSFRDHSWGVRSSVGGFEPTTGGVGSDLPFDIPGSTGTLFIWNAFSAENVSGQFFVLEDEKGICHHCSGFFTFPPESKKPDLHVTSVARDISFIPGTRIYDCITLFVTTEDGQKWEFEAEAVGRSWAMKGAGYNFGYNDEKGLGAYRGKELMEVDEYDLSYAEIVGLPDGRKVNPWQREQPARLSVEGRRGYGHLCLLISGKIERYGVEHYE